LALASLRDTTGPLSRVSIYSRKSGRRKHTAGAGSGVMEPSEVQRAVNSIATGEDVADGLAPTITTTATTLFFTGSHCVGYLPQLRYEKDFVLGVSDKRLSVRFEKFSGSGSAVSCVEDK